MRIVSISATAALAVVAAGGVAYAANTYSVDEAGSSPAGKGSPERPLPKRETFTYSTGSSDGTIPSPIEKYRIDIEGVVSFAKHFPKCELSEADSPSHASACRKARVGGGTIDNYFGPAGSQQSSAGRCLLKLTLYNLGSGLAIRLDSAGAPPPGCPVTVETAFPATNRKVRLQGIRTSSLRFIVPNNLRHPLPGLVNTVAKTVQSVSLKTTRVRIRGRRVRVGFLSSIGCRGKRRTTAVYFTDEGGTTKKATRTSRC